MRFARVITDPPSVGARLRVVRDGEIRHALVEELREVHRGEPSVRVRPEMTVGVGACRVDIGLINGSVSGYEIKSDRDNLSRLPAQILHYGRCLDYASLVVSTHHIAKARTQLPRWWGLFEAKETAPGEVRIVQRRKPRFNPHLDPFYVAQLLWRDEAMGLVHERGLHAGLSKATRWQLWDVLADRLSLDDLREEVRLRLTDRTPS